MTSHRAPRHRIAALPLAAAAAMFSAAAIAAEQPAGVSASDSRFRCGGEAESLSWSIWDSRMRNHLRRQVLEDRLVRRGDANALYDFQNTVHNLVAMARRCGRHARLDEVADLIRIAYGALEAPEEAEDGRRWTCRSGALCQPGSKLHGQEVMLYSVQFLGIATAVANALATSGKRLDEEEREFIADTVAITREHLLRWDGPGDLLKLKAAMAANPGMVAGTSSAFFFTDKHLWLITIHAELAGILEAGKAGADLSPLREHLSTLLRFFNKRISFQEDREGKEEKGAARRLADLDRGYWRLYPDNLYAGYESLASPLSCPDRSRLRDIEEYSASEPSPAAAQAVVRVRPEEVKRRDDTGWDFSHARRLVHALDALERNRAALKKVYRVSEADLPPADLARAFANTLVRKVWNGDRIEPLFANYWSGANGWFRVGYGLERGRCREGFPPYGMSGAFPTGGYATWSRYRPEIGQLARQLYGLTRSPEGARSSFIRRHYPELSAEASQKRRDEAALAFYPTLVDK